MSIAVIDHVQLAMSACREAEAGAFSSERLGIPRRRWSKGSAERHVGAAQDPPQALVEGERSGMGDAGGGEPAEREDGWGRHGGGRTSRTRVA